MSKLLQTRVDDTLATWVEEQAKKEGFSQACFLRRLIIHARAEAATLSIAEAANPAISKRRCSQCGKPGEYDRTGIYLGCDTCR